MSLQFSDFEADLFTSSYEIVDNDAFDFYFSITEPAAHYNFVDANEAPVHSTVDMVVTPHLLPVYSSDDEASSPCSSASAQDESSTSQSSVAHRVTIEDSFIYHAVENGYRDDDGWIHFSKSVANEFAQTVLQGQRKTSRAGRKGRSESKPRTPYARMHDSLHKSGWIRSTDGKEWYYLKSRAK